MIHGISGLVQLRQNKQFGWLLTLLFILGGIAGGGISFTSAWLIMTPIRTILPEFPRQAFLVFIGLLLIGRFTIHNRATYYRQVPRVWLVRFGPPRAYFVFGLSLGAGILTYMPTAATAVAMLVAAVSTSFPIAASIGALFGAVRALPVMSWPAFPADRAAGPSVLRMASSVKAPVGVVASIVALIAPFDLIGTTPV